MSYEVDRIKDAALRHKYELLQQAMRQYGTRYPKKHGEWYRARTFDNNWLVYDTWNGCVYLYRYGAEPTDTDNMYQVVYAFRNSDGSVAFEEVVKPNVADFWRAHIIKQ